MKEFYKDDYATLYNGDCIEVMNYLSDSGVKVNKVITSPPYGVRRVSDSHGNQYYDQYSDVAMKDYVDWSVDIFKCYDRILAKDGCVLYNMSYGHENTELMSLTVSAILQNTNFTLADILIWKKKTAEPNNVSPNKFTRICEFVYVFCRREDFETFTTNKKIKSYSNTGQAYYENVYGFFEANNNDNTTSINKCTFSTDFVYNLLRMYVKDSDLVLDNFSGTGTTCFACKSRNIKCIGIELSEQQCNYSVDRLSQMRPTLLF